MWTDKQNNTQIISSLGSGRASHENTMKTYFYTSMDDTLSFKNDQSQTHHIYRSRESTFFPMTRVFQQTQVSSAEADAVMGLDRKIDSREEIFYAIACLQSRQKILDTVNLLLKMD